jgi:integrase
MTQLLTTDLKHSTRSFVFTTVRGKQLRRSGFQRRLWAPAVNGGQHAGQRWKPIRAGLTFHGLRHSHKTWLIEDGIPEVAQARRLGHTLDDKIDETYSHVAPSVEARLLAGLQNRWERSIKHYLDTREGTGPLSITG